jgi:Stress responsive A/B Barrel Domain
MIVKMVLLRFKRELSEAEEREYQELTAGLNEIPGVTNVAAGTAFGDTGDYSHAFTLQFESVEAHDGYREHPAHKQLGVFTRRIGNEYVLFDFDAYEAAQPVA